MYIKAAENGHIGAMNNLGYLYLNEGNYKEAEKYCTKAIENGHSSGMYNLGAIFEVQGKYEEAKEWYEKAEKQGMKQAKERLKLFAKAEKEANKEKNS